MITKRTWEDVQRAVLIWRLLVSFFWRSLSNPCQTAKLVKSNLRLSRLVWAWAHFAPWLKTKPFGSNRFRLIFRWPSYFPYFTWNFPVDILWSRVAAAYHYVLFRAIEISMLSPVVRPPYSTCARKSRSQHSMFLTFLCTFSFFIRRCPLMGRTIVENLYSVLGGIVSPHRVCASGREMQSMYVCVSARLFF